MAAVDWFILILYALLLVTIGVVSTNRQGDTEEYFRGSRTLPWWAIGLSIIATSFSAASLLGGPGEGFRHGFLWIQLQLGDLLGYLIVIVLFVPLFVNMNLTTAYEFLERRFDRKTRILGALYFLLQVSVRLGGLLYGAALVVATVTDLTLGQSILAVGLVAIFYTMAGGIAAVIWTDVLQVGMIILGVGTTVWVLSGMVEGGLSGMVATAAADGRFQAFDLSWDPRSLRTLPTALMGYALFVVALGTTNQQMVQRYVSCPDVHSARKAILLGWFTGLLGMASTLFMGVLFYVFYKENPGLLPENLPQDDVFPHFIAHSLPPGFTGVVVAAIFAAAMSSIDSALHSLSTSSVVDFYRPFARGERDERHELALARILTVVWGFVGIGSAFLAAGAGKGLLDFMVQYMGYTVGPLFGLFILGSLTQRTNSTGAFYGTLAATLIAIGFHLVDPWVVPGIWYPMLVTPVTVTLGLLISTVAPDPLHGAIQGDQGSGNVDQS